MPYGMVSPVANTSFVRTLPSGPNPRMTRILPGMLSATNKSPFGAVMIVRGELRPVRAWSILNPFGTFGQASAGRGTTFDWLGAESVAYGFGKSEGLMR